MKVKNPLAENATKGDLLSLKGELKGEMRELKEEIVGEIDEKNQKYRDQILTSNDKLAKTLETMREDLEIGHFQMGEKIRDHEGRIKNLEKIPQTA